MGDGAEVGRGRLRRRRVGRVVVLVGDDEGHAGDTTDHQQGGDDAGDDATLPTAGRRLHRGRRHHRTARRRRRQGGQDLVDLGGDAVVDVGALAETDEQGADAVAIVFLGEPVLELADEVALLGQRQLPLLDRAGQLVQVGDRDGRRRRLGPGEGRRRLEREERPRQLVRLRGVDALGLRHVRRQELVRHVLADDDRQDAPLQAVGVVELGPARLRVQRRRAQGEDEAVAAADVLEDRVPPLLTAAELLVEPDVLAQLLALARDGLHRDGVDPCVADEQTLRSHDPLPRQAKETPLAHCRPAHERR